MSSSLKVVLPIVVIAAGAAAAAAMIWSRPEPEKRVPEVPVPLIRVRDVRLGDVRLTVHSQGTVRPRTESTLVTEVAGRVIWVAPSFASGSFFEQGETLVKIDATDYRQAVVQARAAVAQMQLRLESERAEAEVARREWEDLGKGAPSPLALREPQQREAEAALEAARAALERAERDLARTEIRAPYAGRIRDKRVDLGGYVMPGSPVATIYAVDYAEIRLPISDDELAFVKLPLGYRGESARGPRPRVVLRAEFAGRSHEWDATIVRTEGEIDPGTRLIYAVAQVEDPYGEGEVAGRPPLAAGLFVRAEIFGMQVEGVAVIPRSALRGADRVLVVDDENRLRFRRIEILRRLQDDVIVAGGLEAGERVCLSPLAAVTDGMKVRVVGDGADEARGAAS